MDLREVDVDTEIFITTFFWKYKIFDSIEQVEDTIRILCSHLKEDSHPLVTLMTCREARFFLPIFYSLRRCIAPSEFASSFRVLKRMLDDCPNSHVQSFLNRFEEDYEDHLIEEMSKRFTFETIVYCGLIYSFEENKSFHTYEEMLVLQTQYLLEKVKEFLAACPTVFDAMINVGWIVHFVFPVVSSNISAVGEYHVWDPFAEAWRLTRDVKKTFLEIYRFMWEVTRDFMFRESQKWEKERENPWLQFDEPKWEERAEVMEDHCKNGRFISHDDLALQRQKKFLKQMFSEDYECANVPEFYFFEGSSFQLVVTDEKQVKQAKNPLYS